MCGKRESPLNEKVHMQCWFQDVYDNLSEGGEEDYVEPDVQSEGMGKHHDWYEILVLIIIIIIFVINHHTITFNEF